tara:strand:+ start:294 stop:683 length:390 start_codon:yes stop_codon:yes gene_type:complete
MDRITKKQLDTQVNYLNSLTGIEHTIESAYGGYKLTRTVHGVIGGENVFPIGYVPKAELYRMILAYENGFLIEDARKETKYKALTDTVKNEQYMREKKRVLQRERMQKELVYGRAIEEMRRKEGKEVTT